MKQINVWFEEEEHGIISKIKEKHGGNWHDFLMDIAREYEMKGGKDNGFQKKEKKG